MIVYRVTPAAFANSFTGGGARRSGGRWNPKGTAILYSSNSTALCLLEILVNVKQQYLPAYHRMVIEIPDALVDPAAPVFFSELHQSRAYGARWVGENQWAAFRASSSVLVSSADAFNLLLNPNHPAFEQVKLLDSAPLPIDRRLLAGN